MRKTCKCGNVLNDVIVPNKVVYWTVPMSDKEKLTKFIGGDFYQDYRQITIWYCDVCHRFYHWGPDKYFYTYKLSKIENSENIPINWNSTENMYLSFNNFEEDEMDDKYEKDGIFDFPRKVYGGTGFEKIYVQSDNKVKVFIIEEKLSMEE